MTRITCQDLHLGTGAYARCDGKGRKQRITPLSVQTVQVLRVWARERDGQPADPLFPTRAGSPLSRDAVERLVAEHAATAGQRCPSLAAKHVSPHVLRHTCAMQLLQAGVDIATIALWLGHESIETTQIYLHADLALKERALARTAPPDCPPGRYQAPDDLLAFLDSL
ncbi:MAG: tyrosine-type recombinase/integrase [Pseudonocardiaceae bacterium]